MPFESEAQRRKFHAMADRGEMSEATVSHWEHATKNKEDLPYHKKHEKKGSDDALEFFGVKEANVLGTVAKWGGKGLGMLGKAVGTLPTGIGNLAGAALGAAGGAISNAAAAPPGQRLRQGLIGAASGATSGIPGAAGWVAPTLVESGLQKAFGQPKAPPGGMPQAPKPPTMQPNAAQTYAG